MTMPSLIAKHQKKTLEVQFKKAYSELQQANLLLKAKEDIVIHEYAKAHTSQPALDKLMSQMSGAVVLENSKTLAIFIQKFYSPKQLDKKSGFGAYCDVTNVYRTSGGRFYSMDDAPATNDVAGPKLCVDTNGAKKPNSFGYALFVFNFTSDGRVEPLAYRWTVGPISEKLDDLSVQCENSNGTSCSHFAASDTSPLDPNKSYWNDFLK